MSSRLPRFERSPSIKPISVTARDREILRYVHTYRFLNSIHIERLLAAPRQSVLRRLHLLYHHGFLTRPQAQIEYYRRGSSPMVYGISTKGAKLIGKAGASPRCRITEKNDIVGRSFLKHALLVADILVAVEVAARNLPNIRYLPQNEILPGTTAKAKWRVRISRKTTLGIVPDGLFALEKTRPNGEIDRVCYFLEADRGTMPVKRKSLARTSMYRKLLAYQETWAQDLHRSIFAFHRMRVLSVTTGQKRLARLVAACENFKRGHGLFLFCDPVMIRNSELLTLSLETGRVGEQSTMLP